MSCKVLNTQHSKWRLKDKNKQRAPGDGRSMQTSLDKNCFELFTELKWFINGSTVSVLLLCCICCCKSSMSFKSNRCFTSVSIGTYLFVYTSDCFLIDEGIPQNQPNMIQRTITTITSDEREAMRATLTRNLDLISLGLMNPTSHWKRELNYHWPQAVGTQS